ncbi:MAG: hypothetical protein AAF539_04025 [Planctomycetota bacterium]
MDAESGNPYQAAATTNEATTVLGAGRSVMMRRVGVLSAAKICAVMYAIFGLLYGLFVGVFMGLATLGNTGLDGSSAAAASVGISAVMFVMMPVMFAVFGFLGGGIAAVLYNLTARFVGGIQLELAE